MKNNILAKKLASKKKKEGTAGRGDGIDEDANGAGALEEQKSSI
jgi:hypothetical protein